MEIPVFVSCPTTLSDKQAASRAIVIRLLRKYRLEPRDLGRSDYPTELPLREVLVIARHCAGGIILGFEQYRSMQGINKPGTPHQNYQESITSFPTPWNQLEAGILFGPLSAPAQPAARAALAGTTPPAATRFGAAAGTGCRGGG